MDLAPECALGSLGTLVPSPFWSSAGTSHLCVLKSGSGLFVKETELQWVRGFPEGEGEEVAWAARAGWVGGPGGNGTKPGLLLSKVGRLAVAKQVLGKQNKFLEKGSGKGPHSPLEEETGCGHTVDWEGKEAGGEPGPSQTGLSGMEAEVIS